MYVLERSNTNISILELIDNEPNRIIVTMSYENEKEALTIFKYLKRGCGFEGWTPAFMGILK